MLQGKFIKVRNVKTTDLDDLYALSTDFSDAGEYMPLSFVSETVFFNEFRENGFWQDHCGRLIIEDTEDRIVGEAGFFKSAHYIDGREIYYRIFSGHRGKGYAGDTLALLTQFFFESTSMNRIQAVTIKGNDESEHLLKKNGFSYEGTMRQARYFKGKLVDLNQFSLIRSDG